MKGVDPTIKIGANGESWDWWRIVLEGASFAIDFLAVHNYPPNGLGWYSTYQNSDPRFLDVVETARGAIASYAPAADRARLKVAVTETNATDWSGTWPNVNDTGHALVVFDMVGAHLTNGVEFTQLWNTRWSGADTAPEPRLIDTFDSNNNLQATGSALAIWGQFLKERMVFSTSTAMVRTYASYSPGNRTVTAFLINKDTQSRDVTVRIENLSASVVVTKWVFKGTGPNDVRPTLGGSGVLPAAGNMISTSLDPVSVTVLDITPGAAVRSVPGTIEAEDFDAFWDSTNENEGGQYRSTAVDIEPTTDAGGGYNVGWMAGGEWLEYSIDVRSSGIFQISCRVASPIDGTNLRVMVDGHAIGDTINVPNTGSWQSWQSVSTAPVQLSAGTHALRVYTDTGWFNVNWIQIQPAGTPSTFTIEAEDFEAYWDSTDENEGGQYRSTGVDIEPTTDAGGGYNVGWIAAGEWLDYTIDVQSGGTFTIDARVASLWSGTTVRLEIDGLPIGNTLDVPNTGSWQSWDSLYSSARLDTGVHRLRVMTETGGFNINKLIFVRVPGS